MKWIRLVAVVLVAALALSMAGCASTMSGLLLRDTDTRGERAKKIAAHIGLSTITLGLIQIPLGKARRLEQREQQTVQQEEFRQNWEWSMEGARTMGEITRLFGSAPDACFSASERSQICTWTLGRDQMAGNVSFWGDSVNIREVGWECSAVCELPKDGSPREPDSCQLSFE